MSKKTTTEELVPQPQLPVPADFADYGEFSANSSPCAEKVIPWLQLIAANSKALVKSHEKFVPNARAGMFLNRATGLLRESVVFVPCERQHVFVEWIPLEKGGGKVGTYPIDDPRCVKLRQEQGFTKLITPECNEIVETYYVFGYTLSETATDPIPEPAVLTIKSTGLATYRPCFRALDAYLLRDADGNLVRGPNGKPINPPLFSHRLRLTAADKSKNGNDWLVVKFDHLNGDIASSMVPRELLAFGKSIAMDVKTGRAKMEEEENDGTAKEATSAF